jgi:hypothetical protein
MRMSDGGMRMPNGQYQPPYHHAQLPPYGPGSQGAAAAPAAEAAVIRIDLGLTGKQIMMGLGGLASIVTAGITAGWLFLPAKDTDLRKLEGVVQIVTQKQEASNSAIERLTLAVDNLSGLVDGLKNTPPKIIERVTPRPATRGRPEAVR